MRRCRSLYTTVSLLDTPFIGQTGALPLYTLTLAQRAYSRHKTARPEILNAASTRCLSAHRSHHTERSVPCVPCAVVRSPFTCDAIRVPCASWTLFPGAHESFYCTRETLFCPPVIPSTTRDPTCGPLSSPRSSPRAPLLSSVPPIPSIAPN